MNDVSQERWQRLGTALRQERERQGLSQQELANRAGVSVGSVKNAEKGVAPKGRRPYTLTSIADALDWAPSCIDDILSGKPAPTSAREVPVVEVTPVMGGMDDVAQAMYGALKFQMACQQHGAPPPAIADFEAATQRLFAATIRAQSERPRLTQEHFEAVAHSPKGDGGPESDRRAVDEAIRRFDSENL
ncbi:helix-turn-helix transcriptional regulator [Streptomyces sp. SCA3-4]|uniref:helix-turn-helix domain-containing protein n=1 Tax=Streptomyces sichuanensis TaxID=2871810 RepID=UPI001CE36AD7|nr:helix-turn-helix transcriptional regulator [Streptomyces sichuanensis]MCA6090969.1 helix-turn-helix transcriptional regulator [Streptomyces sichuanensis]